MSIKSDTRAFRKFFELPGPRYTVFTRTWWRENPDWPDGLEPCVGRKRTIGHCDTIEAARRMCRQYNETTGQTKANRRLSRKAEFTEN